MSAHLDYLKDLFAPFGDITIRKMFGGAGVYCDGVIFAISADDEVWLKVDDQTRAEFEAVGAAPFTFEMKGKTASMSYHRAPDDIYDDDDALRHWAQLAIAAGSRAKRPAKKKSRKAIKKK